MVSVIRLHTSQDKKDNNLLDHLFSTSVPILINNRLYYIEEKKIIVGILYSLLFIF